MSLREKLSHMQTEKARAQAEAEEQARIAKAKAEAEQREMRAAEIHEQKAAEAALKARNWTD